MTLERALELLRKIAMSVASGHPERAHWLVLIDREVWAALEEFRR